MNAVPGPSSPALACENVPDGCICLSYLDSADGGRRLHKRLSRCARVVLRRRLCGGSARGAAAGGGLRAFHWLAATGYLLSAATGQLFLALSYVWTQVPTPANSLIIRSFECCSL